MGKKSKPQVEASEEAEAEIQEDVELSPEEEIAGLHSRCAELEEKAIRSMADYKNLRRRMLQDSEASLHRHMQPMLEELLFVLDYLDMALASPCDSADAKNLAVGVQMTRTKFAQVLETADVQEIETQGSFDPALHDAKGTKASAEVNEGEILEIQRRGYTWQGKVLRPAQVIVAAKPSASDD
jgi:molecular chaperone GrpE